MEKETINECQSSIEVTKNSKGYTWNIKVYYNQQIEGEENKTLLRIAEINNILKGKYGDAAT